MEVSYKFNNGDEVREIVSGYVGIIMGRSDYLTGCNRYALYDQKVKDGKTTDWVWFDEDVLTLKKSGKITVKKTINPTTGSLRGGPRPANECGNK